MIESFAVSKFLLFAQMLYTLHKHKLMVKLIIVQIIDPDHYK